MNIVFWLIIILILVLVWSFISPSFEEIGEIIVNFFEEVVENIIEGSREDSNEE